MKKTLFAAFALSALSSNHAMADTDGRPNLFGMENACQAVDPINYSGVLSPVIIVGPDIDNNQILFLKCAADETYGLSCPLLAALVAFGSGMMPVLVRDGAPLAQVIDYIDENERALTTYCISSHQPNNAPA